MSSALGSPDPERTGHVSTAKPGIPDYELVRIVGRGSYGDVWLARSVTGAWRAIKVVWRERFPNAEPFEREFRGLKEFADISLGESSQMTLLHVGRNDAAGFFYYVMELADDAKRGRHIVPENYVPLTLAEMRTQRGRIAADECARIGVEVARVLASLHRRGLVHRDVKPSNIILVSGVPKLADVGLVAPSASAHTFVGTEGYVPPEGPGKPSADVFALAKVLYELSTGHDRQEFPKLPAELASLPDRAALLELNEIILRACGPGPTRRYRDGAAILADLTAMNAGVSLRTRRLAAFLLRAAAGVAIVFALGLGVWFWQSRSVPSAPPLAAGVSAHSVAVLPFTNASGDSALEYLSDGISDEIRQTLECERDLRVTGSRSSFWVKGRKLSSVDIARTFRVAHLVEGVLRRNGTRIHLQLRLTRGADGRSEEVGTFEREEVNLLALKDDAARAVAQKILGRVTLPPLAPGTNNPAAYDAFLHGRALQAGGAAKATELEAHFKCAVELDPNFAVAWARLAEAQLRVSGFFKGRMIGNNGMLPETVVASVERALTLQPDLALAWSVRGFVRGLGQEDAARGQRDLFRAEELGGPTAETRMARFLIHWLTGESRGLLPLAREAIAANPVNIERLEIVALAVDFLGDYAEADRLYRQLIVTNGPERSGTHFANWVSLRRRWRGAEAALRLTEKVPPNQSAALPMRVLLLASLGRADEAATLLEGVEPTPEKWKMYADAGLRDLARELAEAELPIVFKLFESDDRSNSSRSDSVRVRLIGIEIWLGRRESALAHLGEWRREVERRSPNFRSAGIVTTMPLLYAALGQHDDVIAVLQRSIADGQGLGYELRDSPSYAGLQNDPSFQEIRRQAEAWAAMQPDPSDDPVATALP